MSMMSTYKNWRTYRNTVAELQGLSNRALSDMGIARGQIRERDGDIVAGVDAMDGGQGRGTGIGHRRATRRRWQGADRLAEVTGVIPFGGGNCRVPASVPQGDRMGAGAASA